MANPSIRFLRAAKALPELWGILLAWSVLAGLSPLVPAAWHTALGWRIHPYQVFAVCVGLALFMLPGAMFLRILDIRGNWLIRLPTALAAAVGVWVLPSMLVATAARFDVHVLVGLGLAITAVLSLAAYLRVLLRPSVSSDEPVDRINVGLAVVGGVSLLVMGYLSFQAPVSLDDNLQLMYVQDNLVVPHINEQEPVFGAGIPPQTRGSLTTWVLNLTVITFFSGLPPQQTFWLLRTPLALLDLLAVYTLVYQLFGKRNQAIFTALVFFVLFLIYTDEADALGFSLFARGAQDKFVARYLMFPMALGWSLAYLRQPSRQVYWLAGVCTIGLATTHPMGIVLLGIPLAGSGVLHLLQYIQFRQLESDGTVRGWVRACLRQNWAMLRPFVLLSFFSILGVIVPLLQKASPDAPVVAYSLTDTHDPTLWFRVNLALNYHRLFVSDFFGPEAYIVHPRVFLESYLILPVLGLPVLWWKARKYLVSELILGTFVLNPVLLLVPPIVQRIGGSATPWLLYRFAWPLTLLGPIFLAWVGWMAIEKLNQAIPMKAIRALIPAAAFILMVMILYKEIERGLLILDEYRTDSFSSRCRTLQPLFNKLPELVGEGSVVLSTPENNLCMVSSAAYAYPVEFGLTTTINRFPESRLKEAVQRLNDVYAFFLGQVVDQEFMNLLTRWNVKFILLKIDHPLEFQLRNLPHLFELVLEQDRYAIYRIRPNIGTDIQADLPVKVRWQQLRWNGKDEWVTANSLWSQGQWEDTIAHYELLSQEGDETGLLGLIGLGRTYFSAGRLSEAASAFSKATEDMPDSFQAWLLLGNTYWVQGDYENMEAAYRKAIALLDWHPGALTRLADALRFQGKNDEARYFYERAIATDVTPGTSLYYRDLGARFLAINWNKEAISTLEQGLSIRESILAYSLLSRAYSNLGDSNAATEAALHIHDLDPWSDATDTLLGRIDFQAGDAEAAIAHFEKATFFNPQTDGIGYLASTSSVVHGNRFALAQIQDLIGYKLGFAGPVLTVAQLELALGRFDDAIVSGNAARAWKPVDSRSDVFLGNAYLIQGNQERASYYYKEAMTVNPLDPGAYVGLASIAQLNGDGGTATGWSWAAMTASPYNPVATVTLGNLFELGGDLDEALYSYQLSTQIGAYDPWTHVAMGNFLAAQGEIDQANAYFQTALALQWNTTSAYRGISSIYRDLGELSEAGKTLTKAVQVRPMEGISRVALAELLLQQDQWDAAFEQLKFAIEFDPGYRPAYTVLGNTYLRLGNDMEAEAVYRQLVETFPMFPDGYLGLGDVYEGRGEFDKAMTIYHQALGRVAPNLSGKLLLAQADLYKRQGQFDAALQAYRESLTNQPMLISGYVELSRFYAHLGDFTSAIRVLETGLALMPASPELNLALGQIQIEQGDIPAALNTYNTALQYPDSNSVAIALATLYASLGQPERAWGEIMRAHQRWPGNVEILAASTTLAVDTGHPEASLSLALELISLAPGRATAWLALGNAYAGLAQFERAETAYSRAVQVEPGDSNAWFVFGEFLIKRGETERAIQAFNQAIEINHREPMPYLALADILKREGQVAESLEQYHTAAQLDATQETAFIAIGNILKAEGKLDEARTYFDRAIATSPLNPEAYQANVELLLIQGRQNAAYLALFHAVQATAGNCLSSVYLANFLAEYGNLKDAQDIYRQASTQVGCMDKAHIELGELYSVQAQPEKALREYQAAVTAVPGEPWNYMVLANAYEKQADFDAAAATYALAAAKIPSSALLQIAQSRSFLTQGKHQDSLNAVLRGVELAPANPENYIELGNSYWAAGAFPEAEQSYLQAANLDQTLAAPYLRLGDLYASLARFDEAESAYRKAILLAPIDPSGYELLAGFLITRNQIEEAISIYEQGAEVDQSQRGALLSLAKYDVQAGLFEDAEEILLQIFGILPASGLTHGDSKRFKAIFGYHLNKVGETSEISLNQVLRESSFKTSEVLCPERLSRYILKPPPSSSQGYVVLGDLRKAQAQWGAAEEAYQTAILVAPGLVDGYLRLGEAYQAQGLMDKAKRQYEQAVTVSPASSRAYISLGNLHSIQGDWTASQNAYQAAINIAGGNFEAYIQLGKVYQSQRDLEQAEEIFAQAVAVAPASATAYTAWGDWFWSQADLSSAERAYRTAIQVETANPTGYIALGRLYQAKGQRGLALAQLQLSAEIAPISSQSHLALGDWYRAEADWIAAESWYYQAIELAPGEVSGYLHLGYVYLGMGYPTEARTQFETAFALAPGYGPVHLALGDWYRMNLEFDASQQAVEEEIQEAVGLLEEAELGEIEDSPDEFIEYLLSGLQYQEDGDVEMAYAMFEAAIAADPNSLLPYLAMGQWYRAVVGLSNVEQAYLTAESLAPGDPEGFIRLGQLYQDTNRDAEALAQFEQAVALAPGIGVAHMALGDFYRARGNWNEAEAAYREAIAVEPGNLVAQIRLGELLESQGRHEEAQTQYEQALVAGITIENSVCGGGLLPSEANGQNEKVSMPTVTLFTNSWRCEWDFRPWSALFNGTGDH